MAEKRTVKLLEYVPLRYPEQYNGCRYYDVQKRIVKVAGYNGNGSGMIVSDNYLVTSLHLDQLTLHSAKFTIYSALTGKKHSATFIESDDLNDVSLLKLDKPIDIEFNEPLKFKEVVAGHRVYSMGYYAQYLDRFKQKALPEPFCSPGKITGDYSMPFWHSTSFGWYGLSGGAIFDVEHGEVVGLNRGLIPKGETRKGNEIYVEDFDSKHTSPVAISNLLKKHNIYHLFNGVEIKAPS